MATDLRKHVDTITHALLAMKDLCADPEALSFEEIREDFERLEAAFNVKATLDALFAYVCERDDAGRVVGSKHANQYLQKKLGLEPKDAYDRLARGRDYYGEPEVEDEPVSDLFDAGFDDNPADPAAEAAREEAARAAAREAARAEAPNRTVKDLRATVRRWVERENRKHVEPTNPNAGMENRGLHIGAQRADGTCRITIDAVASDSALFKALSDKGLVPNSNLPEGVEDYRTPSQRRYDQFSEIVKHYDACEKPTGGGCASVVVSVTLDELAEAGPTTKFATNTGIELDAFDLVRLGMDGTSDFVLTVDDATSLPLNLYRTRRLASLAQRITLLAVQGVCAWTGCTAPLTETEIHHITSWLQGGDTNIDNLTALCRTHHRCNNDFKDHRNNTSHMDVDPATGRAGVKEPRCATLQFNHADAAEHSAVNRLRKRHRQRNRATVPDPGGATAPPETRVPPEPPDPPPPREPVEPPPWAKGQDPYPPF